MTKADVIKKISAQTGIERIDVREVLEGFFEEVQRAVAEGDQVYIRGFGSFLHRKQARKTARNISQNTALIIQPHYKPSFKPSKKFSLRVRETLKVS